MSLSLHPFLVFTGIGDPQEFKSMMVSIRVGMEMERNELLNELVRISINVMILISTVEHSVYVEMLLKSFRLRLKKMRFVLNSLEKKWIVFAKLIH